MAAVEWYSIPVCASLQSCTFTEPPRNAHRGLAVAASRVGERGVWHLHWVPPSPTTRASCDEMRGMTLPSGVARQPGRQALTAGVLLLYVHVQYVVCVYSPL